MSMSIWLCKTSAYCALSSLSVHYCKLQSPVPCCIFLSMMLIWRSILCRTSRRSPGPRRVQAAAVALPLGRGQRRGFRAHGGRPLLLWGTPPGTLEHHQVQQLPGGRRTNWWTRRARRIIDGKNAVIPFFWAVWHCIWSESKKPRSIIPIILPT